MGDGARNLPAREGVDRCLSRRYPGGSAHRDGAGRNRDEGYRSRAVGGQWDEIALLTGRVAEAEGRHDVALDLYRRLAETAERPVAAEATLRWVTLALAEGAMQADEGIARLETLAVAWRGDAGSSRTTT